MSVPFPLVIVVTVARDGSWPIVAMPRCRSPGRPGSLASKAMRVLSGDQVGRQASNLPFVICVAAPPAAGIT